MSLQRESVCFTRNPEQPRNLSSGAPEQYEKAAYCTLNNQAESGVLAVLSCVILVSLSVGMVVGIGLLKTLGAR